MLAAMKPPCWVVLFTPVLVAYAAVGQVEAAPIRALIIDGQNNHYWQTTTPALRKVLEDTGLFQVEVITTPPKEGDFNGFHPRIRKASGSDFQL
jgi:uncharacterized protein